MHNLYNGAIIGPKGSHRPHKMIVGNHINLKFKCLNLLWCLENMVFGMDVRKNDNKFISMKIIMSATWYGVLIKLTQGHK